MTSPTFFLRKFEINAKNTSCSLNCSWMQTLLKKANQFNPTLSTLQLAANLFRRSWQVKLNWKSDFAFPSPNPNKKKKKLLPLTNTLISLITIARCTAAVRCGCTSWVGLSFLAKIFSFNYGFRMREWALCCAIFFGLLLSRCTW